MPVTPERISRTGSRARARSRPVTAIRTPTAARVDRRPARAASAADPSPVREAAARPTPRVSPISPGARPARSRWTPTRTAEKPNANARRPRAARRSARSFRTTPHRPHREPGDDRQQNDRHADRDAPGAEEVDQSRLHEWAACIGPYRPGRRTGGRSEDREGDLAL